jgi:DNA-binding transcriptional MerR regulator
MQIGDVARRTLLSVDAIRFYERSRLLPKPERSVGGFRLYTPEVVDRLHFIRRMQALGFCLREVRELAGLRARKVESCESVQRLLREKLAVVRGKMRELRELESKLLTDLRKCDREIKSRTVRPPRACPALETSGQNR